MALIFYLNISELFLVDKYIPFQGDYSSRMGIPALPFSQKTMKVSKPLKDKYISNPQTVGEHIRNRRLRLGLLQKDVASKIGVTEDCITLWENNESRVRISNMPLVIAFLEYNPIQLDLSSIGGKIKEYRIINGLSHKKMGKLIGVNSTTIGSWEKLEHVPTPSSSKSLNKILQKLCPGK